MDYSQFMEENFIARDWVNSAFGSMKDEKKEQFASTLVMKLQMFVQEVNSVLEESCQQAVQCLPRVGRELQTVKQEALILQEQMRNVKLEVEKVEHNAATSMQTLLHLDEIKSRMKCASDALHEADNWTTLSADVEDAFDSGDMQETSKILVGMQNSLAMLANVSDYDDRCKLLETLKNRLEATLTPQLVSAFNSKTSEALKPHVAIFGDIKRLDQLVKIYQRTQKSQLLVEWEQLVERLSIPEALPQFYARLLQLWEEQLVWCSNVFDDTHSIVCCLISDVLSSLLPSLSSNMEMESRREDPFNFLLSLRDHSNRFMQQLDAETKCLADVEPRKNLHASIVLPYKPYVSAYEKLEKNRLLKDLEVIQLDHFEVSECVSLVEESVGTVMSLMLEAKKRCFDLTDGAAFAKLIVAGNAAMQEYVNQLQRVLVNLQEKCGKVDKEEDDWAQLQLWMSLIEVSGKILLEVANLDQELISSALMISTDNEQPFHNCCPLLEPNEIRVLSGFLEKLRHSSSVLVLQNAQLMCQQFCETVHVAAFKVITAPFDHQMKKFHENKSWNADKSENAIMSNLPDFSLSPLEYMTQIGQSLMTLPQQLEPYSLQDRPALQMAVQYGRLPNSMLKEQPTHFAELWLDAIANHVMNSYTESILSLSNLSDHGLSQIQTDTNYLNNVLEDLGLSLSDRLKDLLMLLQVPAEDLADIGETMPQRMVRAVAVMRKIDLP